MSWVEVADGGISGTELQEQITNITIIVINKANFFIILVYRFFELNQGEIAVNFLSVEESVCAHNKPAKSSLGRIFCLRKKPGWLQGSPSCAAPLPDGNRFAPSASLAQKNIPIQLAHSISAHSKNPKRRRSLRIHFHILKP